MKKQKNLTKKIKRLKDRLAKDAKKLAKLTVKLGAAVAGKASGKRKSVAPAGQARKSKEEKQKPVPKASPKPSVAAAKAKPAPKAKKKLNITPERRAQLAAAMKARWAAKRAGNSQNDSGNQG